LTGTIAAVRRFHDMGPREEDNSLFLLSAVMLVCGAIAFVPWMLEPASADAASAPPNYMTSQNADTSSVRVIIPFTPNTTPSQR
jgi:hypothetical protein